MTEKTHWQPTGDIAQWRARAEMLRQIRDFFRQRQVLEVETPLLASGIGTDPALDPVRALLKNIAGIEQEFYLQTSPEFPMKRLLAAGSGPIFQVARAFRNGEAGKKHNPEFTLLEWYRPGFTLSQLMDEVEALVVALVDLPPPARLTYTELFERHLGIDPLVADLGTLKALAAEKLDVVFDSDNPDHWCDLLFSHCIEPALVEPVFITDYPPSQAALARLGEDAQGRAVALRFELVAGAMELANGYFELDDAREQRRRFTQDIARREKEGLPVYPLDESLLSALEQGIGDCAGVAIGVDRLLMLKSKTDDIRDVISFPVIL